MCSYFAVITMCANLYLAFILINWVSVFLQNYGFSCDRLIFGAFVVKFVLHWIQFSITKVNWKKPLEKMDVNFLRRAKWWYLCTLTSYYETWMITSFLVEYTFCTIVFFENLQGNDFQSETKTFLFIIDCLR